MKKLSNFIIATVVVALGSVAIYAVIDFWANSLPYQYNTDSYLWSRGSTVGYLDLIFISLIFLAMVGFVVWIVYEFSKED